MLDRQFLPNSYMESKIIKFCGFLNPSLESILIVAKRHLRGIVETKEWDFFHHPREIGKQFGMFICDLIWVLVC